MGSYTFAYYNRFLCAAQDDDLPRSVAIALGLREFFVNSARDHHTPSSRLARYLRTMSATLNTIA